MPLVRISLKSTLAKATRAIEAIVRPERVYCALFSEETCSVHFHLFPRTTEIAAQFAVAHPRGNPTFRIASVGLGASDLPFYPYR